MAILIDLLYRTGKNYHTHLFLEECKYVVKEKKVPENIADHDEVSPDGSEKENPEKEN